MSFGRVAVIGAGAAGLAAARALMRAGLEPVVFEAERTLGGTWVYTDEVESDPLSVAPDRRRVHTSMYADLRTNLPRDLMAFREFPFDGRGGGEDGWPRFPTHEQVLTYLARYASRFELLDHIRFATRVERVDPLDADGQPWGEGADEPASWLVRWRVGDGPPTEERFDAVAACNGHFSIPNVPSLPGAATFRGHQLHSHNYRRAQAFAGQKVVLLGGRASGVDIAIELADHAADAIVCSRGVDGTVTLPGCDDVQMRPPIEALDGTSVVLTDGTRIDDVDTLMYCTGYEYRLPFLEPSPIIEVDQGWIHPLYVDVFSTIAPSLGFIGLGNGIIPFPQYELQAAAFAKVLAGTASLPDRAGRDQAAAAHVAALEARGVAPRHFLSQGDDQFVYNAALAEEFGIEPIGPEFEAVFHAVQEARFQDLKRYRDAPIPWLDLESERRAARAGPV